MEPEKSNIPAKPREDLVPPYEAVNRPFPPAWSTSMQAYNFPGSITPTTGSNPFGPYHYPSWWGNLQTWSSPLRYDPFIEPWRPSIHHPMASAGAALAFSGREQSLFGAENPDSMKTPDENLETKSLLTMESLENGKRSSIPEANWEGVQLSLAIGSLGSRDEGHDANNDFPSTEMQQCDMVLGNGEYAQKVASIKNSAAVHQNGSSSAANPTELNQILETGLNASGINPEPENLEDEEEGRARKRKNRESSRRRRMKKKLILLKQYEELSKKVAKLRDENEELKRELLHLSEECVDVTDENDSILEEMAENHGAETIADLSKPILPDSVDGSDMSESII